MRDLTTLTWLTLVVYVWSLILLPISLTSNPPQMSTYILAIFGVLIWATAEPTKEAVSLCTTYNTAIQSTALPLFLCDHIWMPQSSNDPRVVRFKVRVRLWKWMKYQWKSVVCVKITKLCVCAWKKSRVVWNAALQNKRVKELPHICWWLAQIWTLCEEHRKKKIGLVIIINLPISF